MPRLFVVDTNVVVSGVLTFCRASATALLPSAMLDGRLAFAVSADLLAEYRLVLLRPAIVERHGLEPARVDTLLAELTTAAYLRQPPDKLVPDDSDPPPDCAPGDEHVIRLLAHEPRAALVSGDHRLIDAVRGWRDVLTPAELVELLELSSSTDMASPSG